MIAKFLSKYILEVIPSIVATVVGAYIVTHYINAKSDADKPKAEIAAPATVAKPTGTAKAVEVPASKPAKAEATKADSAKGDAETAAETANAPSELRRRQPMFREKAVAKPVVVPPAEAKVEDTRDANEIAREAIARLRNSDPAPATEPPRAQETVRAPEAARPPERAKVNVTYAPVVSAPAPVQAPMANQMPATNAAPPLNDAPALQATQPSTVRADDSFRPTPPAEIPSRPLDLRVKERTSVAEEVVSTAKSVFHAVIPGIN